MVAGLWGISIVCVLIFRALFRESHAIRLKYEDASPMEIERAYELETAQGVLAIVVIAAMIGAWILMVQ